MTTVSALVIVLLIAGFYLLLSGYLLYRIVAGLFRRKKTPESRLAH